MLADDGVEERGDDEEYLQDDGEEEAGAEVISNNRSSIVKYGSFVILSPRYFSIFTAGCEREARQRLGVARLGGFSDKGGVGDIGSGGELEDRLHPSYGKAVISSGLPLPICSEERLQLWGESEVDLL